ncbi:hypothetical protein JKG47_20415 [Acidithiobacillus sp. MC6.1]|nr:hypothetical protein [Acidithiobacillus sp. MC6.1]
MLKRYTQPKRATSGNAWGGLTLPPARRILQAAQGFVGPCGGGEVGGVLLGEEALKIAKALHIFDDQRGVFGGTGECLLEAFLLGADHFQEKIPAAVLEGVHDVVDIGHSGRMAVLYGNGEMVQAGAEVAHEGFGGGGDAEEVIAEIRVVGGGEDLDRALEGVVEVDALGDVSGGILLGDVVGAPVIIAGESEVFE